MRTLIVIPARLGSWRFSKKPLASILSRPMVEHVYKRSRLVHGVNDVVVALCDDEVAQACDQFGGKWIMTSKDSPTACDRVAETALLLGYVSNEDVVINVQGDEPVVPPPAVELTRDLLLSDPSIGCANLVEPVIDASDLSNPHRVKAVLSVKQRLLYLTRQAVPSVTFDINKRSRPYKQTCIMAFRGDFLQSFAALPRSPLELIEGIDLLRLLEHEYPIASGVNPYTTYPVDTPDDIEKVIMALRKDPWFKHGYESVFIAK